MTTVVLGCAEQAVAYELRSQLDEVGGVEVLYVAETTTELAAATVRLDPDVVVVHDRLGPEPVLQVVRDLSVRRPGTAALLVSSDSNPDAYVAAMDAGARGVLAYPLSYEDIQARVAGAAEWSAQMRRLLQGSVDDDLDGPARGRIVALAGGKGGTGTTLVATHLAFDVVREVPGHRVLLVDLDLEKGDVTGLLDVRYRVSVADLAKVSGDLGPRGLADAVTVHESGAHLLLPPREIRDVEHVTAQAVRQILALARQEYDLVLVDVGSHVTPVQASVVEIADEVVAVVTPDVLSLRSLRRNLGHWEKLAVRKPGDVRVLVNRASRQDEVQLDTVAQLAQAPVVSTALPAAFRRLEASVNLRDPALVRDQAWWTALRAVGKEIGVVQDTERAGVAAAEVEAATSRPRRDRRRRRGRDDGAITVETVGVLPAVVLVVALLWQLGVVGLTTVWAGHAATAAARAMSLGESPGEAARERVPAGWRSGLDVTPATYDGGDRVRVSVDVPLVAPGLVRSPWTIDVERRVVLEP